MAVIALLAGIGVPAVKGVLASFESSDRVRDVIGAALSSARAIAISRQKYAGLRFQRDLAGDQYMIFIVQDNEVGPLIPGNLGFRAVAGRNPVRLPRGGGVMDLKIKMDYTPATGYAYQTETGIEAGTLIASNLNIDEDKEVLDVTTFSIIFSPSGKVILHTLKVAHSSSAGGDIFNTLINVRDNGTGMFIEDENPTGGIPPVEGLQIESSRNRFVVFNRSKFSEQPASSPWSGYLRNLQAAKEVYVNPYNGQLVSR